MNPAGPEMIFQELMTHEREENQKDKNSVEVNLSDTVP